MIMNADAIGTILLILSRGQPASQFSVIPSFMSRTSLPVCSNRIFFCLGVHEQIITFDTSDIHGSSDGLMQTIRTYIRPCDVRSLPNTCITKHSCLIHPPGCALR